MNRIDKKFQEIMPNKTFITYITAGFPSIEKTEELILAKIEAGADIVEIGIPFSDPLADGPILQMAASEALKNNISIKEIFKMVMRLRKKTDTPFLFLTYYNIILQYGIQKFIKKCKNIGIDGCIIPDLPYEESKKFNKYCDEQFYLIPLVTPLSGDRISKLVENKKGFIYLVSTVGVTGDKKIGHKYLDETIKNIRSFTKTPISIGFGIRDCEAILEYREKADALIMGTEIVKIINDSNGSSKILKEEIKKFNNCVKNNI